MTLYNSHEQGRACPHGVAVNVLGHFSFFGTSRAPGGTIGIQALEVIVL